MPQSIYSMLMPCPPSLTRPPLIRGEIPFITPGYEKHPIFSPPFEATSGTTTDTVCFSSDIFRFPTRRSSSLQLASLLCSSRGMNSFVLHTWHGFPRPTQGMGSPAPAQGMGSPASAESMAIPLPCTGPLVPPSLRSRHGSLRPCTGHRLTPPLAYTGHSIPRPCTEHPFRPLLHRA